MLQAINVGSEEMQIYKTFMGIPLEVLGVILHQLSGPVLFGFSYVGVAVAVSHLNFIHHSNTHKPWEVWDSRSASEEEFQGVFHCGEKKVCSNDVTYMNNSKSGPASLSLSTSFTFPGNSQIEVEQEKVDSDCTCSKKRYIPQK